MTDAERGLEALNAKRYDEAVDFLSNAIASSRGLPLYSLYLQRATAFIGKKFYTKALHDATKAVELNPTGGEGYLFLGRIFYTLGEFEKSLTYYNIANLNNSGTNTQFASQVQSALKNITNDYQSVKDVVNRGRQALEVGDFRNAQSAFTEAINRKPNVWVYYYYRALSDIGLKQEKQAKQDALKITELNVDWPKSEPLKSGYIQKEGEVNMVHQKRIFYLKSFFLYYFDEKKPEKPKGVVVCYNIQCAKREGGKLFQLETKDRKYFLKAATAEDGMEWLTLINQTRKSTISLPKYEVPDERILKNQNQNKRQSMHGSLPTFTDLESIIEQPYSSSAQMMNAIQNEPRANQNTKSASFHVVPSLQPEPAFPTQTFDEDNIASYGNHSNRISSTTSVDRVPARASTLTSSADRLPTAAQKRSQPVLDIDALREEEEAPKMSNRASMSLGQIPQMSSNNSSFNSGPYAQAPVSSYAAPVQPKEPSYTPSNYASNNSSNYSNNSNYSSSNSNYSSNNSSNSNYSANSNYSSNNANNSSYSNTSAYAPPSNTSSANKSRVQSSRDEPPEEYFKRFNAPVPTAVSKSPSAENTPLLHQGSFGPSSVPGSTAHHRRVVGKKEEEPERGCCESCVVM
eukprot:TRINITY_DN5252_c0_g1_i1.p1 TRINITY_DN5252_c0_g1~~TRINITY_DN5252_c0_g1_i1.p1  ORF type:complete len:630 (-),score=178.17 TRINITY_DN5252_c0_g1_i1:83-1972(-)